MHYFTYNMSSAEMRTCNARSKLNFAAFIYPVGKFHSFSNNKAVTI